MFAAVAIVAAASCQKEINEPINNGGDFTVTASIGADTKTVLEDGADGNKIYWTPGDKIAVYNAEGQEVTFITDITEKSTTATFTNDSEFTVPSSLVAVSPKRTDRGATSYADGIVTGLHIGGTQNAVAGSYDPLFAVAIGTPKSEGSNELIFNNVHSLIKFTIGGTIAPKTIRLKNNGQRAIAGMYDYNIVEKTSTMTGGNPYIDLKGTFEVGQTYYIAATAGLCGGGISLIFDGETVKNTGIDITLEHNKIYNLGTVQLPEEEPEYENDFAKRVWGKYAPDSQGWIVMGAGNLDRGMAMDNQYIYVSKSTAYAPVIKAFNYDGTEAFECDVTGMGGSNQWGDAMQYSVNCVRTMPKADGSYILIACNLKVNEYQVLEIWAWVNGPQSAPTCIGRYAHDSVANATDHRRYGDRFSVKGTWEDGELWFPSMQADDHGKTIVFKTFAGVDNSNRPSTELEDRGYHRMEPSQSNMKDLAFYPDADEVFSTCNANAKFVKLDGTTHETGWLNWAVTDDYSSTHLRTYSYNFFEVNGKKYIAYVKIDEQNGRTGRLVVIEDGDGTLDGFKSALTANTVVFEAPLQHTSDFETESAASTGNTLGNCNVIAKDGVTYIGAHIQGLGLSLFQIK